MFKDRVSSLNSCWGCLNTETGLSFKLRHPLRQALDADQATGLSFCQVGVPEEEGKQLFEALDKEPLAAQVF